MTENVKSKGDLTEVENQMVKKSTGDWVLFLSDDDYWPQDQLQLCLKELDKKSHILSYSVSPYQLIDLENYDSSWNNKYFAKFLRNQELNFRDPWPRDMPFSGDTSLYWKHAPEVTERLDYRFYHLSYLKESSFREEDWAGHWRHKIGAPVKMPEKVEL